MVEAAHADGSVVLRRAPFADNRLVGTRGTATRDRIVRAALAVFAEAGYHGCQVERITAAAGCSRPSFYQYFAGKDDVFRQLAGEVARTLSALTERLDPVTPDDAGWRSLRDWLAGYAAVYDDYWPIFTTFTTAAGSDSAVASGTTRVMTRQTEALRVRIDGNRSDLDAGMILNAVHATNRYRKLASSLQLRWVPARGRQLDSLADVLHRTLFGSEGGRPAVLRPAPPGRLPRAPRLPAPVPAGHGPVARRTRARLVDAGAQVFGTVGFHAARVDDVVAAADVSHGTFYRYFDSLDDVFQVVAARAGRRVLAALDELPDLADGPADALPSWVARYTRTYVDQAPILRDWLAAMPRDPVLSNATRQSLRHAHARLMRFLAGRRFGDTAADAFVLLGVLDLSLVTPAPDPTRPVVALLSRGFIEPPRPV